MELIIKDKRYKLTEIQTSVFTIQGKPYSDIDCISYYPESFKYKSLVFNGKFYAFKPIEDGITT